jgi:hypothetical protein
VTGITVVLDHQPTRLEGTVADETGVRLEEYTVIGFASDPSRWGAETRFIQAGRPDHAGRFRLTGLPPGEYLLAAVDYVETGQWLDPDYLERLRRSAQPRWLAQGQAISLELVSKRP